MDLPEVIERLKNNKYAIPALAVGGIAGVYVLMRQGGGGLGSADIDSALAQAQQAAEQAAAGQGGAAGQDTSAFEAAIASLRQQQEGAIGGIVDYVNQAVQGLVGGLNAQAEQTSRAISDLAAQRSYDQYAAIPQLGSLLQGIVPAFQNMTQSAIPQYVEQPARINPFSQSITRSLQPVKLPSPQPASINSLANNLGKVTGNLVSSWNALIGLKPATSVPQPVSKPIAPTYNSPNIQSYGGIGGSKTVTTSAKSAGSTIGSLSAAAIASFNKALGY